MRFLSPIHDLRSLLLSVSLLSLVAGCGNSVSNHAAARREGIDLFNQHRFSDAAGAFSTAVRENPRDTLSFYYLGECYDRTGDNHRAIQSYRASLNAMPYSVHNARDKDFRATVIERLGAAIARSPTREQEINELERRAEQNRSPLDFFLLARIHASAGDADSAIDAYNRARLLDGKDFQIARSYGLWLEKIGQTNAAVPVLTAANQLNPQDAQVADALRRASVGAPAPSVRAPAD